MIGKVYNASTGETHTVEVEDVISNIAEEYNLSFEDVLKIALRSTLKTASDIDDTTALRMVEYFPEWTSGMELHGDERVQHNGHLYRVRQNHTAQLEPGIATASLYVEVSLEDGTKEHSIPYNNNMELEQGKYYSQNNVLYLCNRSTGVAVFNNLADLVGIYVEVV